MITSTRCTEHLDPEGITPSPHLPHPRSSATHDLACPCREGRCGETHAATAHVTRSEILDHPQTRTTSVPTRSRRDHRRRRLRRRGVRSHRRARQPVRSSAADRKHTPMDSLILLRSAGSSERLQDRPRGSRPWSCPLVMTVLAATHESKGRRMRNRHSEPLRQGVAPEVARTLML